MLIVVQTDAKNSMSEPCLAFVKEILKKIWFVLYSG